MTPKVRQMGMPMCQGTSVFQHIDSVYNFKRRLSVNSWIFFSKFSSIRSDLGNHHLTQQKISHRGMCPNFKPHHPLWQLLGAHWISHFVRCPWEIQSNQLNLQGTYPKYPPNPNIKEFTVSEADESNCNRTKIWNQLWRIWRQTQALKRNNYSSSDWHLMIHRHQGRVLRFLIGFTCSGLLNC